MGFSEVIKINEQECIMEYAYLAAENNIRKYCQERNITLSEKQRNEMIGKMVLKCLEGVWAV